MAGRALGLGDPSLIQPGRSVLQRSKCPLNIYSFLLLQLCATLRVDGHILQSCFVQSCMAHAKGVINTQWHTNMHPNTELWACREHWGIFVFSLIPLLALLFPLLLSLGLAKGRPRGKMPAGFPAFPSWTLTSQINQQEHLRPVSSFPFPYSPSSFLAALLPLLRINIIKAPFESFI